MSPLVSITGRLSSQWSARIRLVWSEHPLEYGNSLGRMPDSRLRHSTLGRSSVAGPAHKFPGFGATVIYYI